MKTLLDFKSLRITGFSDVTDFIMMTVLKCWRENKYAQKSVTNISNLSPTQSVSNTTSLLVCIAAYTNSHEYRARSWREPAKRNGPSLGWKVRLTYSDALQRDL